MDTHCRPRLGFPPAGQPRPSPAGTAQAGRSTTSIYHQNLRPPQAVPWARGSLRAEPEVGALG